MASSTNVTGPNLPSSSAQAVGVAEAPKYKNATEMKTETIKRNAHLSDYDNLADEYTVLVNGLKDPDSDIRKRDEAEVAALRRIPGNEQEARRINKLLTLRRSKWKVEAFGAFRACVRELEAMKKKNTENKGFPGQVNATIAKYQKLMEVTATKTDKDLPAILDSLDTYYKTVLLTSKAGATDEGKRKRKAVDARTRYRKCFERCEQWLEAAKTDSNTTEEQRKRIREHEEQYKKSVAEKSNRGPDRNAAPAPVEQAATHLEATEDSNENEDYEEWCSIFFNDSMFWRDRGFD